MTEHEAIQEVVAESYRTRIDAEELRREVKALLNETILKEHAEDSEKMKCFFQGQETAYATALKLIDEKEKGR